MADHGAEVTAGPGETIEIRLPQLGGTGFLWSVASSENVVIVGDDVDLGEKGRTPGGAATRVLRVQQRGPGPGRLRLVRSRPWETEGGGDAEFEITLTSAAG